MNKDEKVEVRKFALQTAVVREVNSSKYDDNKVISVAKKMEDYLFGNTVSSEKGSHSPYAILDKSLIQFLNSLNDEDRLHLLIVLAKDEGYTLYKKGTGSGMIQQERFRQIMNEHFTGEHDDRYLDSEIVDAAICYALEVSKISLSLEATRIIWPWEKKWWKPSKNPIHNLVKAGALIAAEIDRRLRLKDNQA